MSSNTLLSFNKAKSNQEEEGNSLDSTLDFSIS